MTAQEAPRPRPSQLMAEQVHRLPPALYDALSGVLRTAHRVAADAPDKAARYTSCAKVDWDLIHDLRRALMEYGYEGAGWVFPLDQDDVADGWLKLAVSELERRVEKMEPGIRRELRAGVLVDVPEMVMNVYVERVVCSRCGSDAHWAGPDSGEFACDRHVPRP